MRVAAGVLLIITALANLIGGAAYAGFGGLAGYVGSKAKEGGENVQQNSADAETQQVGEGLSEAGDDLQTAGGMLALWGVFLVILGGMNIAAAVMLFGSKNAQFVKVIGLLEILADAGTMAYWQTFIAAGIGLLAGILALSAAKEISQPAVEPEPAPDAA